MNMDKFLVNVSLSATERNVFKYIIENITTCMDEGVRGVAKNNYTSTSTIMRLAKKLGYNGFVDMVFDIKQKISSDDNGKDMNPIEVFNDNAESEFNVISNEHDIDDFIDILHHNNMFIYGSGFSELVSEYMYKKLLVLGRKCWFVKNIEFETMLNSYKDIMETVIIVSKSGQTPFQVKIAEKAQEQGIKVICFTGSSTSELAKNSDIVFIVPDVNPLDDDNHLSNPFFAYCILLFEKIIEKYYEKYRDI